MTTVVTVTTDLIFSTKIVGTAGALNIDVRSVSDARGLADVLKETDVQLVMVDMSLSGQEASEALREAAIHERRPVTIAYYSHVQSELREAALAAGARHVMTRSQFSEQLPNLLMRFSPGDSSARGES